MLDLDKNQAQWSDFKMETGQYHSQGQKTLAYVLDNRFDVSYEHHY